MPKQLKAGQLVRIRSLIRQAVNVGTIDVNNFRARLIQSGSIGMYIREATESEIFRLYAPYTKSTLETKQGFEVERAFTNICLIGDRLVFARLEEIEIL